MRLIFLHIEKSAGSSMRVLFYRLFDESRVLWWNIHFKNTLADDAALQSKFVLGGHRERDFWRTRNGIFLAVVRDPVARVVSFYNHIVATNVVNWQRLEGFDATSMKNTLKDCLAFRDSFAERQCRYLCGEPKFSRVLEEFERTPFLVGHMERLDDFVSFLCRQLELQPANAPMHNQAKIPGDRSRELDDECLTQIHELTKNDQQLYQFISTQGDGFYSSATDGHWRLARAMMEQTGPGLAGELAVVDAQLGHPAQVTVKLTRKTSHCVLEGGTTLSLAAMCGGAALQESRQSIDNMAGHELLVRLVLPNGVPAEADQLLIRVCNQNGRQAVDNRFPPLMIGLKGQGRKP